MNIARELGHPILNHTTLSLSQVYNIGTDIRNIHMWVKIENPENKKNIK